MGYQSRSAFVADELTSKEIENVAQYLNIMHDADMCFHEGMSSRDRRTMTGTVTSMTIRPITPVMSLMVDDEISNRASFVLFKMRMKRAMMRRHPLSIAVMRRLMRCMGQDTWVTTI